jgi:hypothetical protein
MYADGLHKLLELITSRKFVSGNLTILSCRPVFGAGLLMLTRQQSVLNKFATVERK